MTEKQKEFLTELDALLKKYNISAMYGDDLYTCFESNGDTLRIGNYKNGEFKHIVSNQKSYMPEVP